MINNLNIREFVKMMTLMKNRIWSYSITIFFIAGIYAFHQIMIAFINENLLNGVVNGDTELLKKAIFTAIGVFLFAALASPICMYLFDKSVLNSITDIKLNLFKAVQRLPVSYFEKNHSGDIMSRMSNDVNAVEEGYRYHIYMLLEGLLYGGGAIVAMFVLEWRLALLTFILGTISVMITLLYAKPLREISEKIQLYSSDLTVKMVDILAGIRMLKMFNLTTLFASGFGRKNDHVVGKSLERIRKNAEMKGLNFLLSTLSLMGVFIVGAIMTKNGEIEIGTVMGVITLQNGVSYFFLNFGNFFSQLQSSLAGSERIFELLQQTKEPIRYDVDGVVRENEMINMEEVIFGYNDDETILNLASLSVIKGTTVALVGESGGGKSTLLKLLLGFYTPSSGKISINGKPLNSYTVDELRRLICYVPQESFLYDGTVADNIRVGCIDAPGERVIQAAKLANAHEFIMEMSEGYDTSVGERGIRLSGGQRQRIAIARAILRNAPILLLDEATSALDSESEELVQQALNTLMTGRTTIVIAHRLSTIKNADKICVIKDGQVVQQGKHDELLEQHGVYRNLHLSYL